MIKLLTKLKCLFGRHKPSEADKLELLRRFVGDTYDDWMHTKCVRCGWPIGLFLRQDKNGFDVVNGVG